MDDMNAFERLVGGEVQRAAEPVRPVDDLALYTAVTATRSPKWRFRSMFSATKFVVAGVIVALFGGFLLAGLASQPRDDDFAPAVVTESPVPMTTEEMLSGMVTEEVEPGVFRVLSDGAGHDLASSLPILQVAAGPEGSVWLRRTLGSRSRLIRLGEPGGHDATRLDRYSPDITVAEDGTVWAVGIDSQPYREGPGTDQLLSLRDGKWTRHDVPKRVHVVGVEIAADGSVWTNRAVRTNEFRPCGSNGKKHRCRIYRPAVARLVDGAWSEVSVDPAWHTGDAGYLAVGPDGSALLGVTFGRDGARKGLMALEGAEWAPAITIDTDDGRSGFIGPVVVGGDGTVWAFERGVSVEPWSPRLHRRTGDRWEVLGEDGTVPWLVGDFTFGTDHWDPSMTVSDDGTLWVALGNRAPLEWHRSRGNSVLAGLEGPCAGVLSFDGETWGHHLVGACASDVSAAPGGSIWVAVGQDTDGPPGGLYVITPEAVAASE